MLMNLRIKFWGIEKTGNTANGPTDARTGGLRVKIPARYAKESVLGEISAKTRAECEIINKNGIKFLLERHRHRLGIYAGAFIGIAMIYISTFFIWDVQIAKSDYPDDAEIIELLEKLGCKTGVLIRNLDAVEVQNRAILASSGKISWIAVNIKGTVAHVEVKKTEPAAEIIDQTTPVNIIASKTGRIIFIDTYEGEQTAAEETVAQKGDLLISGAIDSEMLGVRIKHAAGKVVAETTRIIEVIIPLEATEKYYTGNIVNKNSLNILGRNINLFFRSGVSMEKYDRTRETKNITLFNAVVLPVKISKATYQEFEMKNIKIDENTAKDIAISKINCIIDNRFGADENIIGIKSKNYKGESANGYFHMICTVELIENIAKEMPFETNIKTEN
jgi:similar to stage IV sporulation protein